MIIIILSENERMGSLLPVSQIRQLKRHMCKLSFAVCNLKIM